MIVLLLGGMAVHGWMTVERLVAEHRQATEDALLLTTATQALGERAVDIERSARQFLLLRDPDFRLRVEDHLTQSLVQLQHLERFSTLVDARLVAEWQAAAARLREALENSAGSAVLTPLLAELSRLAGQLTGAAQQGADQLNSQLLAALEARRLRLGMQVGLALVGALLVALAMGWWLVRPVRRIEQAIVGLGSSHFDQPIQVGGPDDLQQIGDRLDWLRRRLVALEADRVRALRHVSHELKTPLTALKEGVALMREEVPGELTPAQQEIVLILEHNVSTLQQQIEGLLRLNAAGGMAAGEGRELVPVSDCLAGVVQRRELHAQARRVAVVIEGEPMPTLLVDGERLGIILDNLLSNALDFSPPDSTVELRYWQRDGGLFIECRDQGPGIAEEDMERIFEPFIQGRRAPPMPRQGGGVGLSIVRELVQAMRGTVKVVAAPVGAHFLVELPNVG